MPARFRTYQFDTSGITGSSDTLAAAITTTTATAITLTSGTATVSGTQLLCGSERMLITAGGGTSSLTVQRGYGGTTAATHSSGATVSVAGALVFTLMQIAQIPNQEFVLAKITPDINYVEIMPHSGDGFQGGASALLLADATASAGTARILAPAGSVTWILTAEPTVGGGLIVGGSTPATAEVQDIAVTAPTTVSYAETDGALLCVRLTQDSTGHAVTWGTMFATHTPAVSITPSTVTTAIFLGMGGKWVLMALPVAGLHS